MPVESLKQVTNIVSVQNSYNTSTAEITELKKTDKRLDKHVIL